MRVRFSENKVKKWKSKLIKPKKCNRGRNINQEQFLDLREFVTCVATQIANANWQRATTTENARMRTRNRHFLGQLQASF